MPSTPRSAGQAPLVAGLAVTQTVSWGVLYYAFSVLLVPMQDELGWARSTLVGGFTTAIVLSGLAAPLVGRLLDAEVTRPLITGGSLLGVAAVLLWSRAGAVVAYYAAWAAIGLAMAAVLYDPAFTVLAKRTAPDHRRAITAVTLVAGLASFIFQPFTSALVDRLGWRDALVVLAVVLAAVTIPIHLLVLGPAERPGPRGAAPPPGPRRRGRRSRPPEASDPRFWALTGAFVGVTTASLATGVLLIAFLVDHGWSLARASLAGGTLGAMQLPGRLAFSPLAARLPRHVLVAALFTVPALGIGVLLVGAGSRAVWLAVALLGFGQGATTLLRATLYVDLFGVERIGALNGLSGTPITCARALAPLLASVVVARTGSYTVAFLGLIGCSLGAAVGAAGVLRRFGEPPIGARLSAMTTEPQLRLRAAAAGLRREFDGVFRPETIDTVLESSYQHLAGGASVQASVPQLAERFTRQRLRALARAEGKASDGVPIVLFVCVHNAGRSQMALGWFEHLAGGRAVAWSGGSEPGPEVNPAAVEAMAEVGIDISDEYPKPWTREIVGAADVVVTMGCGDACPVFPGKRYQDWQLEDPAGKGVDAVRPIRDEIERRVRELLDNLGASADRSNSSFG